jgi:hypothetical protein
MTEITRFRLARSPRRLAEQEKAVYRVLRTGEEPSAFLAAVRNAIAAPLGDGDEASRRRVLVMRIANAATTMNGAEDIAALVAFLRELDVALLEFVPAPTPQEFEDLLVKLVGRASLDLPAGNVPVARKLTASSLWPATRSRMGDALVYLHLFRPDVLSGQGPTVTGGVETVERVTRWFLLMGLIEAFAAGMFVLQSAQDVADLIFRRTVLLPSPPFPLQVWVPLLAATKFARRPAFVDLTVVRDEWCCFVPAEIAYIENVIKGEVRERRLHQLEEREGTDAREDGTLSVRDSSTESSDRVSFKEDVQRALQIAVALEGQVDVSGSYGTVKFAAHVGAEMELGYSQTERRGSETSREIVERVAQRQEERVRKVRTERTLRRSEERNAHTIDNKTNPTGHITAIYRWVDKITRYRNFVYPHRYVLEFQLAEPGARLRWLQSTQPAPEMLTPVPPQLTMTGSQGGERLSPERISRDNYLQLTSLFRAQGVPEPPHATVDVAGAIELKAEQQLGTDANSNMANVPRAVGRAELAVPPGYLGVRLRAAMAGVPQLATWRDGSEQSNDYYQDIWGYHSMVATASVGSSRINLRNTTAAVVQSFNMSEGVQFPEMWNGSSSAIFAGEIALTGPLTGTAAVAVTFAGGFHGHATVALQCDLSKQAEGEWQLTVYQRLVAAYQDWKSRYDDERRNQTTSAGITIAGQSPAKNRERILEEIKRQVIELMMGADFEGYRLMRAPDAQRGPLPDFQALRSATPTIQFLEQAFEWQNLSYVPYPFYWKERAGWADLERLRDNDSDWERFLRSGSARVVVPARPGYEYAVEYYAAFGEPWSGGAAPAPDDPLYVSVAQEIREMTGGGDPGTPGDMWESKQPTTLVWLDADAALPKRNEYSGKAFEGEPDPQLCPDQTP